MKDPKVFAFVFVITLLYACVWAVAAPLGSTMTLRFVLGFGLMFAPMYTYYRLIG